MPFKDFVTSFVRQWNFTRSETLEILNSLSDEELRFKPEGKTFQPLYYQFGCILRTQVVYTRAIVEGKMDFTWFHEESLLVKTRKELKAKFEKADKEWGMAIKNKRRDEKFKIAWPGFKQSVPNHIVSLVAHERLHHGQLITYFTLAGFELPKNFKNNWAL